VENAAPFAFILYADKTRLSTQGTAKGYPVVARCSNLPTHIRNGDQMGGGCIVGWLPIVSALLITKD
jgi:Plavaka transposase